MKFKQAQKFRVIVNGVSVYTTAKQIRWGFGDFVREIKHYKTRWGIPPDRIAFRDAWKATQLQTFCLHNNTTQGVSK